MLKCTNSKCLLFKRNCNVINVMFKRFYAGSSLKVTGEFDQYYALQTIKFAFLTSTYKKTILIFCYESAWLYHYSQKNKNFTKIVRTLIVVKIIESKVSRHFYFSF